MATERQSPNAIVTSANYSPAITVSDISDDPDSPDGTFGAWDGNGDTDCVAGFPTPTGNPTTGAALQEFRTWVRKTSTGGNAVGYTLQLYENGTLVSTLGTGTVTSTTGQIVSGTWDASSLGTADGSLVECRIAQTSGGSGNPGNRRAMEVGAVEWNVTYGAGAAPPPAVFFGANF